MSTPNDKKMVGSLTELIEELDKRYSNSAISVAERFSANSEAYIEYIGKLKLIREIKVLIGATND